MCLGRHIFTEIGQINYGFYRRYYSFTNLKLCFPRSYNMFSTLIEVLRTNKRLEHKGLTSDVTLETKRNLKLL